MSSRRAFAVAVATVLLSFAGYQAIVAATLSQQAYLKPTVVEAQDLFGWTVAVSGNIAVVGTPFEDSAAAGVNGNDLDNSLPYAGAAYVFERENGVWTQRAYLKASNPDQYDLFGYSVAIDGTTIVVGAPGESGPGNAAWRSGAAYVFVREGSTWVQQAYLKPSLVDVDATFGLSVGLSGNTAVVGAPEEDVSASVLRGGAAYVFTRQATSWTEQARIVALNTVTDDRFGSSVSVSSDVLAIGAPSKDGSSGSAYAFNRSGSSWSQQAYLKAGNSGAADLFGTSVAASGETVVVGAPGEDGSRADPTGNSLPESGAAYVFTRTAGVWGQQAYLKAPNAGPGDIFGYSVAASGTRIAIGAPWEDSAPAAGGSGDATPESGAAYVFVRVGDAWKALPIAKAFNADPADSFGWSVALAQETVVAGAISEAGGNAAVNPDGSDNSVAGAGAVYVYGINPNQTPTAAAGADQSLQTPTTSVQATLDGAASFDPDGDPLSFTWRDTADQVVGTTASVTLTLPLGTHTFTLTVDDGFGGEASDTVTVTVRGTPQILWTPPADVVSGTALGPAQLNASANVPGVRTYMPSAGTVLPLGIHTLRVDFVPTSPLYVPVSHEVSIRVVRAGTIAGSVTNGTTGAPVGDVTVQVYGTNGALFASAVSDETGRYQVVGIPGQGYRARTTNAPGLVDEVFDNLSCALGCNVAVGTIITATSAQVAVANFALLPPNPAGSIGGTVRASSTGAPLANVAVTVFSSSGAPVAATMTNAQGNYLTGTLVNGNYYVKTTNDHGFIDELYQNISCAIGCNVTSGTVVTPTQSTTGGVANFDLDRGARLLGRVDTADGPLAGAVVQVHNGTGQLVTEIPTDTAGEWRTRALPGGTYFARTRNGAGYQNMLYNAIQCAAGCAVTSGTPITATVGLDIGNVTFNLLPNTRAGTNVVVSPETLSGTTPLSVAYGSVTVAGRTTVTTSSLGPTLPSGYRFGSQALYYELATTATFQAPAELCVTYTDGSFVDESAVRLMQHVDGAWTDVTQTVYVGFNMACGYVATFSRFALVQPTAPSPPATDVTALLSVTTGPFFWVPNTDRFVQPVWVANASGATVQGPISFVLDGLTGNTTVIGAEGRTTCSSPANSQYLDVYLGSSGLAHGEWRFFLMEVTASPLVPPTYTPRVLAGPGCR